MNPVRQLAALLALASVIAPAASAMQIPPEPEVGDLLDAHRAFDVPPVRASPRPEALIPLSVDLRWPGGAAVDASVTGGELVVHYDKRVDEAAARAFATAAGDRLARFDWAYDTLVIRPRADMTIAAETLADGVRVTFTPIAALQSAAGDPAAMLALIGAQADAAAGYPGRSRRRLATLAAGAPDDATLQQALAEAEFADDRVADGARRYRLLGEVPGSTIDPRLLDRARRLAGARVETSAATRDGRGFDQAEGVVRASVPLGSGLAIEGGVRVVRTSASEIIAAGGRQFDVARSVGVGEFGAAFGVAPAIRVRALVAGLLDGGVVGGAATVVAGDPELQATARLAWRLPDFATAEGAMLGGYLNRAALGGFVRPMPGLGVRGEVGLNRYGLKHEGVVAHTTTVEGSAEWLIWRQRPTLALVYRLDAEYVGFRAIRPFGHPFLPLSDRENHTGELVASQPLGRHVTVNAAGGWTADRFGGNGPSASGGIRYASDDGWEASAIVGISSITRPDQRDHQIFGRLAVIKRFGMTA